MRAKLFFVCSLLALLASIAWKIIQLLNALHPTGGTPAGVI
jgi:hypothetical protein